MMNEISELVLTDLSPVIIDLNNALASLKIDRNVSQWMRDPANKQRVQIVRRRVDVALGKLNALATKAQRDLRQQYKQTMILSFCIIGGLALLALIVNWSLLRYFPKAKIQWRHIAISLILSSLLIITTEILFFFLITRRLRAVSPELLTFQVVSLIRQSLHDEIDLLETNSFPPT